MHKVLSTLFEEFDKLSNVFGRHTIALLAISLVIAMMTIFFSDSWIMSIKEKNMQIYELRDLTAELNQLQSNILKAESAQRGYLLTGSPAYLRPFEQVVLDARKNFQNVEIIIRNVKAPESYQKAHVLLDKLKRSFEAKVSEMNLTLQFAQKGEFKEARKITNLDSGLTEMQNIDAYSQALLKLFNHKLETVFIDLDNTRILARASVIIGPLVLIFLVVLVIKQLLKELSDKAALQQSLFEKNEEYALKAAAQSNLLRSLALDYQSDVERERQKLAREIHDELGSILTATKMDISWTIKTLKTEWPELVEKLRKTSKFLDRGINFKRQIVQDLHPSVISSFGFWPALKTLIEDATERNQWNLTLMLPDENTKIDETISLVAYRVVQETINNTQKYAQATELSIHIISDEKNLKIEIQDNGIGFEHDKLQNNTHGLSGMRHRVLAIGGHFEIVTSPGKGVLTHVLLPLDVKPDRL